MKSKEYLKYILIGLLLVQLEFVMYTEITFFHYLSFIIILPLMYILRLSIHKKAVRGYEIYIIGIIIMYVYGVLSNTFPLFMIAITVGFIWYSQNKLTEKTGYNLFAHIIMMYLLFGLGRFVMFVYMYNLDIDFTTAFVVNTLAVSVLNAVLAFIVIQIKREVNTEVIE